MTRTLVVLGASLDQVFLIRTAREMGLHVLALDQNPASPGFDAAQDHAVISTRDVPAVCAFLDDWNGPPIAGVITMGSDIPDIVAAVAQHAGVPHIPLEAARLATDKYAMKVCFRDAGVPIPWFCEVASAKELKVIQRERGPELVLKPVDRSGSRGVFLLDETSNLDDLFAKARDFSFSGRVQVEEFLPGLQISTETILSDGRALTPGFADRNYELLDRFRPQIMENGGWVPSILSDEQRRQVEEVVEYAARALGIRDGVAKGDVVITPEGPKVIEIAARLSGGDFCAGLVPLGIGVNYVRSAIAIAVGDTPDFDALQPRFNRAVANRYLFPPAGRLVRIDGIDEVRAMEGLEKLELWYEPGDVLPDSSLSHAHRFGVFVVTGPDRDTVQERVDRVYATLDVVVEAVTAAA